MYDFDNEIKLYNIYAQNKQSNMKIIEEKLATKIFHLCLNLLIVVIVYYLTKGASLFNMLFQGRPVWGKIALLVTNAEHNFSRQ